MREFSFKYSFDDLAIGIMFIGQSSLATRAIARPKGLTNDEWFRFAGDTCKLLNDLL